MRQSYTVNRDDENVDKFMNHEFEYFANIIQACGRAYSKSVTGSVEETRITRHKPKQRRSEKAYAVNTG